MVLPTKLEPYFWDTPLKNISLLINANFVIERILEYGDREAFLWLKRKFTEQKIIEVLKTSRRLSAKTGNYFALIYNLPREELLCLRKPYTQKQNRF